MAHDPETGEADRLPGAPHPRERIRLIGQEAAERAFLDAAASGRLHHAWLLTGREGIGKATFAYRAARYLLAGAPQGRGPASGNGLALGPDHPVFRQVAAQSHPDLVVIRRAPAAEKKQAATEIKVDDVRTALQRFGNTAGLDGWRVGIVDSAEDLNASSANALLKLIEEPPPRTAFFFIAHRPGRLLPTIRSRCRRLALEPLSQPDIAAIMRDVGPPWSDLDDATIAAAAARADGSAREAMMLATPETLALVDSVEALLRRLPDYDPVAVLGLADTLAGRAGERDFALALETIRRFVSGEIGGRAGEGAARLAPLVEVWEKIAQAVRDAEAYNLDRRPLILSMIRDLSEAMRRSRRAA